MWLRKYRLPGERARCIYNGVDSSRFSVSGMTDVAAAFRKSLGIPENSIVVGSVGRFAPEKHFELLIDAIGRLCETGRPAYLLLVGEGRERRTLERAAARVGISDRVRFPGVMSDVRSALAAMDVFVLPSRAVETFSNAALEAMAMSRPVVLSNIGGAAEMVTDKVNGFLFDSNDIGTLTQVLVALHDSAELRETIGAAARDRIVRCFTFEEMVSDYQQLLGV